MITNDPIRDFERHDREQELLLEQRPVCSKCGEHIQQEYAVFYNEQFVCEDCERELWEDIREDFMIPIEE